MPSIKFVVTGLLLGILMSSMDNTIVATAMGTIVADLGGLEQFVWVTSAYMIAVMAGMPIFGKLSDMYGRKKFYLFGLIVFLIGSALCGLAQNIMQLSIYRAIQGIGGGALMPIAFTIVSDLFPPKERGKMTGLLGAVFGISSVFGPLIGAYITEKISWHWIFYVNLPIGLLSLFFISYGYKEVAKREKKKIDYLGASTLVISIVSLMFALELGGKEWAWDSAPIFGLLASFAIFFFIFIWAEKRAAEPVISFEMFKNKLFAASQAIAFFYGTAFIILTVYIPIFVQAVYGGSASNAGLILTPMMLGTVGGSTVSGLFMAKVPFRNLMWVSISSFLIGMFLLGMLNPETPRALLTFEMILAGFGVGFSFSLLPTSSIHGLNPTQRGSANSTNNFFRSFGMTLGISIFGSIQSKTFSSQLKASLPSSTSGSMGNMQEIFASEARAKIPPHILEKIVAAMSESISFCFSLAVIPLVCSIFFIWLMGKANASS